MGVLIGYPKKRKQRDAVFAEAGEKGIKVVILKNRKEVRDFCEKLKLPLPRLRAGPTS